MPTNLVPAAQYLRMSTEHQQYSLGNQSAAILKYAELNGFEVVRTYSDSARSGVSLRRRSGLIRLLQDVAGKSCGYQAILVYDVSRWGRFQDTDESAHYEFLCKAAGSPVHYCAETFANDGSLASLIMKALKRTMAGEYSRELGVKVLAGLGRLVKLGFKPGGTPGYGLRRLLVSPDGTPKQMLAPGERKSIATDRVVFVPGPAHEVQCIRDIYWMFISENLNPDGIARELNRRGIESATGSRWGYAAVVAILTHPKYAGCAVFGRTTSRLHTPRVWLPKSEWIVVPGAFDAIVDHPTFEAAQAILANRTYNRTDEDLLASLRSFLAASGKLSRTSIHHSPDLPSPSTYRKRFGSLKRAYELVGYGRAIHYGATDLRQRTKAVRDELIDQIVALFADVAVVRRGGRWRGRLRICGRLVVSVLVARYVPLPESVRWHVRPVNGERKFLTLLARLNKENTSWFDLHLLPRIDRRVAFRLSLRDPWLNRALRLDDLSQFRRLVDKLQRLKSRQANKVLRSRKAQRIVSQAASRRFMPTPTPEAPDLTGDGCGAYYERKSAPKDEQ